MENKNSIADMPQFSENVYERLHSLALTQSSIIIGTTSHAQGLKNLLTKGESDFDAEDENEI
jgi:hypothetical protein